MDVTGLKDYNFRRFQTEYCVYTKHGLKIEQNRNHDFSFKIESKSIIWLKSHIVTALNSNVIFVNNHCGYYSRNKVE